MTPPESPLLRMALAYAAQGWPVLALHSVDPAGRCSCGCSDPACTTRGKHPRWDRVLQPQGLHSATTDPEAIRARWTRWPGANIGTPTGTATGRVVLDVDGADGEASLAAAEALPPTPVVATGRGWQYYFLPPVPPLKNAVKFQPGLDTRGEGGYAILPPSRHYSGRRYRWHVRPTDQALAVLPAWITAATAPPPLPPRMEPESAGAVRPTAALAERLLRGALDDVRAGKGRNDTGFALACQLRDNGFAEWEADRVGAQYVAQVPLGDAPYTRGEWTHSLQQAYRAAPRAPWPRREAPDPEEVMAAREARETAVSKMETAPVPAIAPLPARAFDPTTGELPGAVDKDALILELAQRLATSEARNAALEADLAAKEAAHTRLAALDRWTRRLFRLPHLLPAVLRVAYCLRRMVEAGELPEQEPGTDWRRVKMFRLSTWARISEKQAGHYVKLLADLGWLARREVAAADQTTHILVALDPALLGDDPRSLPLPEANPRGGPRTKRLCAACGEAALVAEIYRCTHCGAEQMGDGTLLDRASGELGAALVDPFSNLESDPAGGSAPAADHAALVAELDRRLAARGVGSGAPPAPSAAPGFQNGKPVVVAAPQRQPGPPCPNGPGCTCGRLHY